MIYTVSLKYTSQDELKPGDIQFRSVPTEEIIDRAERLVGDDEAWGGIRIILDRELKEDDGSPIAIGLTDDRLLMVQREAS